MEIAGGAFGWSEDRFWGCSMQYFMATVTGYMQAHGIKSASPPSREEYEETVEKYSAELALTSDDLRRLRAKQKAV